jgi:hypothetical protein
VSTLRRIVFLLLLISARGCASVTKGSHTCKQLRRSLLAGEFLLLLSRRPLRAGYRRRLLCILPLQDSFLETKGKKTAAVVRQFL